VKGAINNLPQLRDLPPMFHPTWLVVLLFVVWLATCAG